MTLSKKQIYDRNTWIFVRTKGTYRPDSIKSYLRSMNEFFDISMLKGSELHLSLISNEKIQFTAEKMSK